jgi:hypothetical protein
MSSKKIIAFTGPIGSGKTYAANYLVKSLGYTNMSFADPIKRIALNLGFTAPQVYGTQEDKLTINDLWGISFREFAQKFGTDIVRDRFPDVFKKTFEDDTPLWVKIMKNRIDNCENNFIVIDDLRFPDESKMLSEYNALIIKIESEPSPYVSDHISEVKMREIKEHKCIINTKCEETFKTDILSCMSKQYFPEVEDDSSEDDSDEDDEYSNKLDIISDKLDNIDIKISQNNINKLHFMFLMGGMLLYLVFKVFITNRLV